MTDVTRRSAVVRRGGWHRTLRRRREYRVVVVYLMDLGRRALGELRQIARAETPTHAEFRDRVMGLLVVTIGVDLICALLAYLFEHGQPMTQIRSYGSALFWTSTQLLTVSSQIENPSSVAGRVLDVGMEAYAITVVATMAGTVGSFMVRRARDAEREAGAGAR